MNPLQPLLEYGQSHWQDNLTRGIVRSGELALRVSEDGLRGRLAGRPQLEAIDEQRLHHQPALFGGERARRLFRDDVEAIGGEPGRSADDPATTTHSGTVALKTALKTAPKTARTKPGLGRARVDLPPPLGHRQSVGADSYTER